MMKKLPLKKVSPEARMPEYATEGAAGMDLFACLRLPGQYIPAGQIRLIPTGIATEIDPRFMLEIRPRSGLALKGLIAVNGTIDSDFRGEIMVILQNLSDRGHLVTHGERVAQLVLTPIERIKWTAVSSLSSTERAEKGFGSTGLKGMGKGPGGEKE